MMKMAPGLERYLNSQDLMKDIKYDIEERDHFLKATIDDLARLKTRSKWLFKNLNKIEKQMQNANRRGSAISKYSRMTDNSAMISAYQWNKKINDQQETWTMQDLTEDSDSDSDASKNISSMIKASNFFQ